MMLLLLLLHERRTTDSHELLFSWFRRLSAVTRVEWYNYGAVVLCFLTSMLFNSTE